MLNRVSIAYLGMEDYEQKYFRYRFGLRWLARCCGFWQNQPRNWF